MQMTRFEKRFVNDIGHSHSVAEAAVRRLAHMPVQVGWLYLDVGCGNGAAARLVAATSGMHVVGVDVDPDQIALARSRTDPRSDARFIAADATCLPFGDGLFDIVATNKTTHHVPQWSSALSEMTRVLKPHGYLVYADLKTPSWLAWAMRAMTSHVGVFTRADLDQYFAPLQRVHRHAGWVHYEAILQKP
jgi:ubiquinone/menaquinone biosynthesis C-methylase UbiE